MKTNPFQTDRISAHAAPVTANSRLQDNLRSLRLSYLFENAVPAAEHAARDGQGHLHYLQELIAGEVALRHDRSVQRRIHDARFPVIKTIAGWDWNWPAKLNRMQVEHLFQLDFLIDVHKSFVIYGVGRQLRIHEPSSNGQKARRLISARESLSVEEFVQACSTKARRCLVLLSG